MIERALAVIVTSVLVVVGLLNGACGTGPSEYHCWQPGRCYVQSWDESCPPEMSRDEGPCPETLRVGSCVRGGEGEGEGEGGRRIYLYAPLHGLLPPNCERIAGPGAHFEPERD